MTPIEIAKKDSLSVHTYCTRDSSSIGSNIGIGSWSVSTYRMFIYTSANNCVDRLNTEGGRHSASWVMCCDPICQPFSKMPQVRTMHDKPGCVPTLPTVS